MHDNGYELRTIRTDKVLYANELGYSARNVEPGLTVKTDSSSPLSLGK